MCWNGLNKLCLIFKHYLLLMFVVFVSADGDFDESFLLTVVVSKGIF